ncbi:hypothetical protein ARALYDRAFT_915459 [Arabidopsis lyrata subsp. lyrata]|uniref:Uncharacterized protein n=1 Tax=Arabidopsis lyrata subsp. lyrata TaxID=81972 RepID=D7MH47_ARALL|nr:hypothetical protein ARALYDRAFT_915459 [Arabidopsis lyrata subsp. lyrata]
MSQLIISRVFKPSISKNFLRHTNIVRMFSSTTSRTSGLDSDETETKVTRPFSSEPAYPFLLIDYITNIPNSTPDGRVLIYDDSSKGKAKQVAIQDEKLEEEVIDAMTVGFSRDGLGFDISPYNDKPVISYEPSNPKLEDMTVHLPSLPTGNFLCYLGLNSKENDEPKSIDLEFDKLPKSVFQELADVSSCSRTDHLVESPTGQLFLVKWTWRTMKTIHSCT